MPHTQFILKTSDGVDLFAQRWLPTGEVRASINLIHGLGEHSGRYAHVAESMNKAGYAVTAIDLRGHGKTGKPLGHIPSYDTAAGDIHVLLGESSKIFPGVPAFLYGHSLGGALALYTCLFHAPPVKGAVVTSPGLIPGSVPKAKVMAAKILSRLTPSFAMKNGLDVSNLSHDPSVIKAYQSDPLVHPLISARLGYELITNGQKIFSFSGDFPVPLLLMQGGQDRLVSPKINQQFAGKLDGTTTFKLFPDGYHELHNEPWKDIVFETITHWIESHIN